MMINKPNGNVPFCSFRFVLAELFFSLKGQLPVHPRLSNKLVFSRSPKNYLAAPSVLQSEYGSLDSPRDRGERNAFLRSDTAYAFSVELMNVGLPEQNISNTFANVLGLRELNYLLQLLS